MTAAGPTASRDLVGGRVQLCLCLRVHPEVTSLYHTKVGQLRVPELFSHTALWWFPDHGCMKNVPFHYSFSSRVQALLLTSATPVSLSILGSLVHLGPVHVSGVSLAPLQSISTGTLTSTRLGLLALQGRVSLTGR